MSDFLLYTIFVYNKTC